MQPPWRRWRSAHLFSSLDRIVHVFLAADAEVLNRLGDAFQWAVDVLRVHVLCVIVKSTAQTGNHTIIIALLHTHHTACTAFYPRSSVEARTHKCNSFSPCLQDLHVCCTLVMVYSGRDWSGKWLGWPSWLEIGVCGASEGCPSLPEEEVNPYCRCLPALDVQ